MTVAPEIAQLLDNLSQAETRPFTSVPLEESRRMAQFLNLLGGELEDRAETQDRRIAGPAGEIPIRIYRPPGATPQATVVYLHGGGFVIGDITSHDTICHRLALNAPAVVVSVDYRLAPEHPYPAAPDDAEAATNWCAGHLADLGGEGRPLVVAGDSAGGNLAAVTAQRCRDHGGPPLAAQLLIYPCTDLTGSHASRTTNSEGYLLTTEQAKWFETSYLGADGDATDPDVSPLFAEDLSGLPPALVITAEYDPLRDEGEAYANRLRAAGVKVEHTRYDGMIHGFFGMDAVTEAAGRAGRQVAAAAVGRSA